MGDPGISEARRIPRWLAGLGVSLCGWGSLPKNRRHSQAHHQSPWLAIARERALGHHRRMLKSDSSSVDPLLRPRLLVILLCLALNVVWMVCCSQLAFSSWKTAAALIALVLLIMGAFAARRQDAVLGALLVGGLMFGVVELAADAYLVSVAKTCDFSLDGGSPKLWCSPIYMPLAWQVVVAQIAVISLYLHDRWRWKGLLAAGLFGAATMPVYEEMARLAKWWQYSDCRMIHNTPVHEIVAYVVIMQAIAWAAPLLQNPSHRLIRAATLGVIGGLVTLAAFVITHSLIG